MVRIIGIDPGLQRTGYGIIDVDHHRTVYVHHGVIQSRAKDPLSLRLFSLYEELSKVFEEFHPAEAAVEETFVNVNPASTLKLGMARGVVLMVPSKYQANVFEYSANRVKKAVVGAGHATKDQVALMVHRLLNLHQRMPQKNTPQSVSKKKIPTINDLEKKVISFHDDNLKKTLPSGDGADALAIALCHAYFRTLRALEQYAS